MRLSRWKIKKKAFVLFMALFALILGWRTYIYLRYSESLVHNRILEATPLPLIPRGLEKCDY